MRVRFDEKSEFSATTMPMTKTCLSCHYTENPIDALICIKCSRRLADHVTTNRILEAPILRESTTAFAPVAVATSSLDPKVLDPHASQLKKPLGLDDLFRPVLNTPARHRHEGLLLRNEVAIYINSSDEPLIMYVVRDTVMGRYSGQYSDQRADIDLAEWRALEHGVSRCHAMMRRFGPDVGIIDLGSTNGTWLNGVRLEPRQFVMLKDGDRVFLGQLPMQIYIAPPDAPMGKTGPLPALS